jgi:hypothetical protein
MPESDPEPDAVLHGSESEDAAVYVLAEWKESGFEPLPVSIRLPYI